MNFDRPDLDPDLDIGFLFPVSDPVLLEGRISNLSVLNAKTAKEYKKYDQWTRKNVYQRFFPMSNIMT